MAKTLGVHRQCHRENERPRRGCLPGRPGAPGHFARSKSAEETGHRVFKTHNGIACEVNAGDNTPVKMLEAQSQPRGLQWKYLWRGRRNSDGLWKRIPGSGGGGSNGSSHNKRREERAKGIGVGRRRQDLAKKRNRSKLVNARESAKAKDQRQ